jgi:hypothetical protein
VLRTIAHADKAAEGRSCRFRVLRASGERRDGARYPEALADFADRVAWQRSASWRCGSGLAAAGDPRTGATRATTSWPAMKVMADYPPDWNARARDGAGACLALELATRPRPSRPWRMCPALASVRVSSAGGDSRSGPCSRATDAALDRKDAGASRRLRRARSRSRYTASGGTRGARGDAR